MTTSSGRAVDVGHRGHRGSGVQRTCRPDKRIYFLKREVIECYRAVHPLLPPWRTSSGPTNRGATAEIVIYFRDVNDHVERVHDEITAQRELLANALEANLAVLSVRQNETTKRLTTIATIFLPLSSSPASSG